MMFALAFAFGLHTGQEHPTGDRWFAADKAKHFFLAAFIQSATYSTLRTAGAHRDAARVGASVVSLGVSVGKELADRRGGGVASGKDLTWDVAGIAGASLLLTRTGR